MMARQSPTSSVAPTADGMPLLGLGTWENDNPSECANTIKTALEMGYRHIDTAQVYGNEGAVGQGIAAADVPREEMFIATKVWIDKLGYEDVLTSTQRSLEKLGIDTVDLLYVHWPVDTYNPVETFRALHKLVSDGKADRIGISNFEPNQVDTAIEKANVPIFANQIEIHPLLPQQELRDHCSKHDIELVAYSPLARGAVFDVPEITAIANNHDVSEAQIALAWLRQKGITAIPKAVGHDHIHDNWTSLDLELTPAEIEQIDSIERTNRCVDPRFAPW
ncbi:aldo/keto reductase [Haloquadratum walsbyi]|mgnify:FL=1|jgi:2,5-diketo-D-gluconate reductase B|uniref:Probable oxidoreductase (Aldo-keto reductase family protein) n=1 Tax=Haloquadratum walsbyi (strain DSM 16790 / HBSQ001) TaxID=362976 RepID=Q18JZ3_HALWD|nr:aldo/keto reductase [Haloquadratum walsbyi]CAJ51661.1 probable oxidoreductase (aldo-keto reductase family protein) [Haloquadratum walsbyi DSM 16790]